MLSWSFIECGKKPLDCQILVDRFRGFTFCQFSQITSSERDTTKINTVTTMFQGRQIENIYVTAISIAFSNFDRIPASIFNNDNFGNISRIKFYGGELKYIDKESFQNASYLKFIDIVDTKIEKITSNAFEGAVNLEEITLKNCVIEDIETDAFSSLEKLKKIRVKTKSNLNFLKFIPKSVEIVESF